jgi:hypothetical protein
MLQRIDLVFSYWIFVWYILYVNKLTIYNPKFVLGLGIIENIIVFISMIYFSSKISTIIWFLFINTFIKFIPFYTLIHEYIKIQDIIASIALFLVYCVWIYMNGESVIEYQNKIFDSLIHNKNATPFMYLISKLHNFLNKS